MAWLLSSGHQMYGGPPDKSIPAACVDREIETEDDSAIDPRVSDRPNFIHGPGSLDVRADRRRCIDKRLYRHHVGCAMEMAYPGFEWDAGNRQKCQRHGVSLREIESLFDRPIAVFPDPAHSMAEERFKAIGRTDGGRSVLLVFTLRRRAGRTFIRPISARYMHRKEVEYYEKEAADAAQRRGG